MTDEESVVSAIPLPRAPALRFYLLGPMRIEHDRAAVHLPRRKVESLLAYLLLHPEQHARDHLATLFWGDSSDAQARHSLRTALATVRQLVSPDLLHTDRDHVQLNPDFPLWVDLQQLLVLASENIAANPEMLRGRLALWQGELLAGFYDEWIFHEREHYRTRLLAVFLEVVQSLRGHSEYALAIEVAQRVLAFDPANEHAHQHLMFCYVAAGNRPAALRQYELCERALEEELDASPMPETTALYHWIQQLDEDAATPASRITNLPIPLTSFVGRTRETADVKRLLSPHTYHGQRQNGHGKNGASASEHSGYEDRGYEDRGYEHSGRERDGDEPQKPDPRANQESSSRPIRALTLIGAGGNGKTRLAIQAATDLIDSFAHGVWWVELAALTDGALVAWAVAKALGVRENVDEPLIETLASFIGNKTMLLVIDNCEHLIDACAQLAATLLARAPNLQILATSRVPLNIAGEALWQVPTFAVPDPTKLTLVDLLLQFESMRLFVERATAVQPTFVLTEENARAVAEICQRLDGIPLAIELAAARVKVLSVEQIAAYLASALGARFTLLTQGSRTVLPRHQTLRATIDWSYDLLDAAARQLFRQVAIFRGGFTLEMLEQLVASPLGHSAPGTLDLLTELVDQSLVIVEQHAGQNRYRLLETLRDYALEQIPSAEELANLQQRHAAIFLDFAGHAEPEVERVRDQTWLNRLAVDHANLRAALDYLISHGDGEHALRLATALHTFWEIRGYVSEGRNWLHAALAHRAGATAITQAKAWNAAGWLAFRQGELEAARQAHEAALALFQQVGEQIGIADTQLYLVALDMTRGEYGMAQRRMEEAQALYQAANHKPGLALTFRRLGTLAWDQDRFADAATYHSQSLRLYQEIGNLSSSAHELLAVGDAERMLGDLDAARTHYEACLTIARELEHRGLTGATLKSLGLLAFKQADYAQARQFGEGALAIFSELGDKVHMAFALSSLGGVAYKLGEHRQALAYFGESLQIMHSVGYKWPTFAALEDVAQLLTEAGQHLEMAVRLLAAADLLRQETGIAVAPNEQSKYEHTSTLLQAHFGAEGFRTLWEAGQHTQLSELVHAATQLTLT